MLAVFSYYIYYIIAAIIGFLLGIFFFGLLNEIFDIYYFGFAGVISTFGGCWFAGTLIALLLGWVAIIILIVMYIAKAFKRNKKGDAT